MNVRASRPCRLAHRLRAGTRELRPPRRTLFRWLRIGPGAAVTLGRAGLGLDGQVPGRVSVGAHVSVGDHVDVHLGPEGRVEIADDVVLGHHVQIAADRLVRIGAGCRIGDHCVLVDTWTYGPPDGPAPAPPPEPVTLEPGVHLGVRSVVGPGMRVPSGTTVPPGTLLHAGLEVEA